MSCSRPRRSQTLRYRSPVAVPAAALFAVLSCLLALIVVPTAASASGTKASGTAPGGTLPGGKGIKKSDKSISPPRSGYVVYWDQDEEEDYYASATGTTGQLEAPWDPNGQMCIVPHTNGEYVVGYDPTNPSQHNPGGPPGHPFKNPPIGEELQNHYGVWTGQNLFVPGPFSVKKGLQGGDSPEKSGVFNGQSTFTGCVAMPNGNVVGADIGTAQGTFPVPHDGRLVEWFAPKYTSYCILTGPTSGGVGPHHVDGTGGLAQPGMMALTTNGDILLPEAGSTVSGQLLGGSVLRIAHTSLPTSAAQCPGGLYPQGDLHSSVFMQGTATFMAFPMGIAKDPKCECFAVDSAFGSPAIAFFAKTGKRLTTRPSIPGEGITTIGKNPNAFNPFGMAFTPTGTLYFVDIHLTCTKDLTGCGPGNFDGRIMRVTFAATGQPQLPPTVIASDFAFPTSVTICVIGHGTCPFPAFKTPPPSPETQAEA
jgi:hypothetical protein